MSFQDRLQHRLERLAKLDLRRELDPVEPPMGPIIRRNGTEYINFSSNDYLGYAASSPDAEAQSNREEGSGGSRLVCGDRSVLHELEAELADWKGRQQAVLFGSGYLTSLGVLRAITTGRDAILLDEWAHRSLIEGARLSDAKVETFNHNDMEQLEDLLKNRKENHDAIIVVSEGLFSMDGDRPPLEKLDRVTSTHDAWLFLDEAHSAGVLGPEGAGLTRAHSIQPEVTMGTLSKAVGTYGGYVVGDEPLKDFLINRATPAIYSTALPPRLVEVTLEHIQRLRDDQTTRNRLKSNVKRVCEELEGLGIPLPSPPSQIVPLVTGRPEPTLEAAKILRETGLDAVPIRYPTVPRTAGRIRLSLRADHTGDQLDRLVTGAEKLVERDLIQEDVPW